MEVHKISVRIFLAFMFMYAGLVLAFSGTGASLFDHLHIALDASNSILSMLFAIFLWTSVDQAHASKVRPYIAIAFAYAAFTEITHALMGIEWLGDFAWIKDSTNRFRPATWPPSTYMLPIALSWAFLLERNGRRPSYRYFVAALASVTVLLFVIFFHIHSYLAIDFLNIQRPFQIPVLFILLAVAVQFWRFRARDPLYEPLVYCAIFLLLSDTFMLYSTSPHEKWTMIAHIGKFFGYILMHFMMIDLSMKDITARHEAEAEVLKLAHYDHLTGLPNRVLLADRLHQVMLHSQRRTSNLAVAFIDLDGFKAVNDSYGHAAGDHLLKVLAGRMQQVLREGDTLARMGGDEFVIVFVDVASPSACEPILDRLLQVTNQPVPIGDAMVQVSASIGVTLYPQDDSDADLLLRHADQAMYKAKQQGKSRYSYFAAE